MEDVYSVAPIKEGKEIAEWIGQKRMSDAQKILISQCFKVTGRIGHSYYVPSIGQ